MLCLGLLLYIQVDRVVHQERNSHGNEDKFGMDEEAKEDEVED